MTFKVGQRIRTTNINYGDVPPTWEIGDEGVIDVVVEKDQWANVIFDTSRDGYSWGDIVNFDEMEAIDE